jgi:formate dehydrogenase beta subunit
MAGLLDQGFDAVLVAVGLPSSKKIAVEGAHLEGVLWGLDFLTEVKAGGKPRLGKQVVIIGGGNVAIDVAMAALRLSGGTVSLYCLESRGEMPAYTHEIERAEAEGIQINPSWGPATIRGDNGRVKGLELRRCLTVFDEQGNFAPTFNERERTKVEADTVILAIGQAPPQDIPEERAGTFLAGDIAGGDMSVVHAVASGRAAAERIDQYLGGDGDLSLSFGEHAPPSPWIGREEGFAPKPRQPLPCPSPDERCRDFREIEGAYPEQQAVAEARRCLQCDLRLMIAAPLLPPETWLDFSRENLEQVPEVDGVLVLADEAKKPITIKGMANIKAGLLEQLESSSEASFFRWEEDRMYTKRESELIQQHLKQYGELPGGGDDELDDLF